jgi:phenylacetaldehyde dehydrogenase
MLPTPEPITSLAIGDATSRFLAKPHAMLIGSEWRNAVSGASIDVSDPASGETITTVPSAEHADVDVAVKAARAAFESAEWGAARPVDRERWLLRLADLVAANLQELAEIESVDNGKPLAITQRVDVPSAVDFLRYCAGWATKVEGTTVDLSMPGFRRHEFLGYTRREPVGVVGAIIPWNFPLLMAVWKIGPALATGCTIVLKPAEDTPLSALRLAELALEAGLPGGALNVVTGYGPSAGAALASHPGIDKIAFTGSTAVGKLVGRAAIDNVTRISLELGGKSPVIVLDDADPKVAASGAANAIFFNSGQSCVAGSRLYVQRRAYDAVIDGVSTMAAKMRMGPGLDPKTQLGPLVSEKQLRRVSDYVKAGIGEGGTVVAGGQRHGERGWFYQPTILTGVPQSASTVQDEIFGPVLVAAPFDDVDEIAALANETAYGLSASIWSNDLKRVHRLIPRIKAGTIWVNCHGLLDSALPFGGYKQSGIGREMGKAMLDLYTETKSVMMMH